jgi:hypothetical protein
MMEDAFGRVRALNIEGYALPPASASDATTARAAAAAGAKAEAGKSPRELEVDMNDQMVIVVGALCKMFVGDLVHGGQSRGLCACVCTCLCYWGGVGRHVRSNLVDAVYIQPPTSGLSYVCQTIDRC